MKSRLLLAVFSLCACPGPPEEPRKVAELPSGDVPLHLIVSNQSFDEELVDIDVFVDGVHVITGDFDVGSQHTFYSFDFMTTAGTHTLRADANYGSVEFETDFEVPSETWGTLMFWYYATAQGGQEATPTQLSWKSQQTRPMFD